MIGNIVRYRVLPLAVAFLLVILFIVVLVRLANTGADVVEERERAIALAQEVYARKKAEGMDFSAGPCLSENLMDGWVADIVHAPRQPVDDEPENQCQAYREGRAFRLVELDPDGNVIRAQ